MFAALLFLTAPLLLAVDVVNGQASCGTCVPKHKYDEDRHQSVYKVGVLNFRGPDSAYAQHNETFATYLSATAGKRFDPPIRFEMVPVDFQSMFDLVGDRMVDFVYLSPSPFACVEAEFGAQSLVSHIAKRVVGGNTYTLEKFAGVIAARADNYNITTLQDLKGKVVAAAAISSFGGGAMQFREVIKAGLSFVNDPKQIVFTGNQGEIVNGVIDGKFDLGFIRTDQIQRTTDADGNLIDPDLIKVIEPKANMLNGVPFPFLASTQLYPEWNLGALDFVPSEVSQEVQASMLALKDHSLAGEAIQACLLDANITAANNDVSSSFFCNDLATVFPEGRCDTTVEIATIAARAMTNGLYAGFRTTQSYIEIRAMLQDTGFIQKDKYTNTWKCARPDFLYEAIVCPPGHFKKPEWEVENGCSKVGLECDEGHQCLCNPCQKAFDVDIFPIDKERGGDPATGCPKMSLCGSTAQLEPLQYLAVDNLKRVGAIMNVTVREGELEVRHVEVVQDPLTFDYEFSVTAKTRGILIVEIFLNGEQIPESPLRVQIYKRECDDDHQEADEAGSCVCMASHITVGDSCLPNSILVVIILAPFCVLFLVGVWCYVEKKKKEADTIWHVAAGDLHFDSPPEVIGAGAFGLVLLAEYRGTQVAVKRALPPRTVGPNQEKTFDDEYESAETIRKTVGYPTDVVSKDKRVGLTAIPSDAELVSANFATDEPEAALDSGKRKPPAAFQDLELQARNGNRNRNNFGGVHARNIGLSSGHPSHASGTKSTLKSTVITNSRSGSKFRFGFTGSSRFSRSNQKAEFIAEMRLLSKLRHPCITTIMGAVISKTDDPMLVMEYCCHGSLHDILHNETMVIEGDLVYNILLDIVQGVRFLHAAQPPVVHGDLKSANILIDSRFRAKVSDFGLSSHKKQAVTGSPYFMAPELLRNETLNTIQSDMYAIGIILYEVYSRKDPYDGENAVDVLKEVCDSDINKRPPLPKNCPPVIVKIMKKLLSSSPSSRPSAAELDNRLKALDASTVAPLETGSSRRLKNIQASDGADRNEFLYKVFPRHIADVLASGGKPEPESHEIVTIFFSDIVGFTNISSNFSPIKVSDMLDRLYHAFDDLASKHGLFKLETIGDAYLAVSNLTEDQREDHVKRVAQFAIEAVKVASEIPVDSEDPESATVKIRVGFHSGPVVSNVVGNLNPRFGLFGDTINVASRMESTSEKGRIHCSERSALILMTQAPQIPVRLRGETTVKGKGAMKTYWVN